MVCQAANQTRFKAFNHENGIAGRTSIIVRIIACFQPLQNCQAEYFRQLLKPVTIYKSDLFAGFITPTSIIQISLSALMSSIKESQNMSSLDHMALLQPEQDDAYNLPRTNTGQENRLFLKQVLSNRNISYLTGNPYLKDSKNVDSSGAHQRKFFISDKSGNQTRSFFGPRFSPRNQIFASNTTPSSAEGPFCKMEAKENLDFLTKPIVEEKSDDNNLSDGENDIIEDSEEIDALLDSESDDDDDVTSTAHSPFTFGNGYNKDKSLEEVTSSDYFQKRQKLLDGKYEKSTFDDDDDGDDIYSRKREKKVKIREALKIFESVIPGLNTKDTLSIIDNAIVYLKTMKTEAEALGFSYPGDKSFILS